MVELVDTQDLKSCLQQCKCGSDSRLGHKKGDKTFVPFFVYTSPECGTTQYDCTAKTMHAVDPIIEILAYW